MAKHTLYIEPDFDFFIAGISSHAKDYRLCWAINNALGIDLKKVNSLEITSIKQQNPTNYSTFNFVDEEQFLEYFVINNMSEGKKSIPSTNLLFDEPIMNEFLLPEIKNFNYFLIIKGEMLDSIETFILSKINTIELVLTCVKLNVNQLKSKENLIF